MSESTNSSIFVLLDGKEAYLRITEDCLVLQYAHEDEPRQCKTFQICPPSICICRSKKRTRPRAVMLRDILWAEASNGTLEINYAKHTSKTEVAPATRKYQLMFDNQSGAQMWIEQLLEASYGKSLQRKRLKVLINPFSGPGNANTVWKIHANPLFLAAHVTLSITHTKYREHAITIAEELDIDAYDAIVCVSGDGLPHEVFNGLAKRKDARKALKVPVVLLPGGSGNGMTMSTFGTPTVSHAALAMIKGIYTPIDLCSVTQGSKRTLSFLTQSFGIIADCDLGTEGLRWAGGQRFVMGLVQRVLGLKVYPCDVAVKIIDSDKDTIKRKIKYDVRKQFNTKEDGDATEGIPDLAFGTVQDPVPSDWTVVKYEDLTNFYAGKCPWVSMDSCFFPAAITDDGLLDLVIVRAPKSHQSSVSADGSHSALLPPPAGRWQSIKYLTATEEGGKHFNMDCVSYLKVAGFRLTPRKREGYVSIDGEPILHEAFQVEVHQALGATLTVDGKFYQGHSQTWP
ncbi:sphingosine kinase [Saitoella complicata NRRL Y-17804]|nr:sphingosine kinase [Saitoella complicata NRRL Y-17804]ODQ55992.1 sphingosine kinase [Saitoella complicata NRRL Y-17804]